MSTITKRLGLLTARELSDATGMGVKVIRSMTRDGLLPHVLIGKRHYYSRERIARWADEGGARSLPEAK
jgi:hypothetical protein